MGDPIKELHTLLVEQGHLEGADADLGNFEAKLADPARRKALYDQLVAKAPDLVAGVSYDEFDHNLAPAGDVKKKIGGAEPLPISSAPSAVPTADNGSKPDPLRPFADEGPVANAENSATKPFESPFAGTPPNASPAQPAVAPTPQPKLQTDSLDPFQRERVGPEVIARNPQAPPFTLTGKEDPVDVGGKFRRMIEPDYDAMDSRANEYPWRKGERDLEKITLYGQEALRQTTAAASLMGRHLGPDWQKEFSKYATEIQPMLDGTYQATNAADAAYKQEALQFYAQVKNEPSFQLWADGQAALAKAQTSFDEYGKKNPEYALRLAEQKAGIKQADAQVGYAIQNWTGQKATQLVAGILALPRTLFGLPSSPLMRTDVIKKTPLYNWSEQLGDVADSWIERVALSSPTGSGENRSLWEKVAPFEGKEVVVDDSGVVQGTYVDGKKVDVDNEFLQRFSKAGGAKMAESQFTGAGSAAFKLASVVADLYLMRSMGGGTMSGTTGVAFALQHQSAYNTALNDLKLTGDDASKYAFVSAGISALIEASIGNVETTPLKLQAAKSLGMREAKALLGKASVYDIAKASWKPMLHEIGMENVEELVDNASQTLNNQVFNAVTGSTLNTKMRPQDAAETIVLTTLTTGLAGGVDAARTGKDQVHTMALNAAVQNPAAYDAALKQLLDGGVIDQSRATAEHDRIAHLSQVDARLPKTLTQDDRQEVINLEDLRFALNGQAATAPSPALKKAAEDNLKKLDSRIARIINAPMEDGNQVIPDEPTVDENGVLHDPANKDITPANPASPAGEVQNTGEVAITAENSDPAAVTPASTAGNGEQIVAQETAVPADTADTSVSISPENPTMAAPSDATPFDYQVTGDSLGDHRLVPVKDRKGPNLSDAIRDRNTTVAQVADAYGEKVIGDEFMDDVTNLAINSLLGPQRKALGEGVAGLRDFLNDHLRDEAWTRSVNNHPFQSTIENLAGEYVRENTQTKPSPERAMSRRLQPATVHDYIAQVFAEGVRVRLGNAASDATEMKKDGGTRLQYTSRNGVPLDLLAQDIMTSMGQDPDSSGSQDVQNEILAFINENPNGPGDYLRKTIAERELISSGLSEEMTQSGYSSTEIQAAAEGATQINAGLNEKEQAEVGSFVDAYSDGAGRIDVERLLSDWGKWDPFETPDSPISHLSPDAYNAISEQIKQIQNDGPKQGTDQTAGRDEAPVSKENTVLTQPGQGSGTTATTPGETAPAGPKEVQRVVRQAKFANDPMQIEHALAEVDAALATIELPEDMNAALAREMRLDGVIDQPTHEAVLNHLGGSESPADLTAYESAVASIEKLREVVAEGPDPSPRPEMDGPAVLLSPKILTMADGTILVDDAIGFADLLREAGGKYDQGLGGWLFSPEIADRVGQALSTRRTGGSDVTAVLDLEVKNTTSLGPSKVVLTTPGALLKKGRTKTRLAAAKNLEERLAVAKEAHKIDRNRDVATVRRNLRRLSRAFPNIDIVTDTATIDQVKKELGVTGPVLGFEYQGKVHVDPRVARPDTPIHEFGHIWNTWQKENEPDLYERGKALARESDLLQTVKNHAPYKDKTEDEQMDEVLAISIGERGALMGGSDLVLRFRSYLQSLWSSAQRAFGINPRFATLQEFAGAQALRMLGSRPAMTETSSRIAELTAGLAPLRAQYGGENGAKGAVLDNLDTALSMEEEGIADENIFYATGWYRGVDGQWRWVIDANIRYRIQRGPGLPQKIPLNEAIDYPALFEAYPEMGSTQIEFHRDMPTGVAATAHNTTRGTVSIEMSAETFFADMTILVHEIQHVIQAAEGFARGSSTPVIASVMDQELENIGRDFLSDPESADPGLQQYIDKRLERANKYSLRPWEGYLKTAGEVEARAAQTMNTPDVYPPSLYDVAPEEQILLFHDGTRYDLTPPRMQVDLSNAETIARAATAREIIALEIQENGLTTLQKQIPRIAEGLGMDLTHVKMIYEEEAGRTMGRIVLTPNNLNEKEETRAEKFMRKFQGKNAERAGVIKRKLSTTKGLGKELFNVDEERLGKIARRLKDGEYLIHKLEGAMEETYGMQMKEVRVAGIKIPAAIHQQVKTNQSVQSAHWQHVDNVLRGQGDWSTLPPVVRAAAERIRAFTDSLTRDLVRSGVMNGEVIITVLNNAGLTVNQGALENYNGVNVYEALGKLPFERSGSEHQAIEDLLLSTQNNIGNYLYRSYQKHDDTDWKYEVTPRMRADAKRLLESNINSEIKNLEQARTDKADKLQENIDQVQSEIDTMLDGLDAEVEAVKQQKADLAAKRRSAVKNDRPTAQIEKSYAAADKALRNLSERARQARNVSLQDASDLVDMDASDFAHLTVAAKRVIGKRREIARLNERIEAAANYRQGAMDSMLHSLANVDVLIDQIIAADDSPVGQLTQSKLGGKDLKSLKKRQEIAPEIRAIMGEYHDPRINFAKSMYRMTHLLENQKFLTHLREHFAGEFFIPPGELRAGFKEISSTGSETMSPLNGWQTTPEIHHVLNNYFARPAGGDDVTSKMYRAYTKMVAAVKYGKTILSPVTHVRNFVGNIFFMMNNAYNPLINSKPLLAFKDAFSKRMTEDEKAYVLELTELRILNNGTYIGAIKELLHTVQADTAKEFFRNRLTGGFNKVLRVAEDTYGAEDDFYRIIAYENEKKRYAKRLYGGKFESLSLSEQKAVRDKAADVVLSTLPTYSRVPELVNDIQRFPFTGTFVAFPAEMFRVTANHWRLVHSDMKDPRTRTLGLQRMIGGLIAQGGMSAALTALGHFLTGIDWEEDAMARSMMLPWQKDGVITYLDFKPGEEFRFINTSYTDPYSFMKRPIANLALNYGASMEDKIGEAMYDFVQPFVSTELTAGTIGQIIYNKDTRSGKPVYSESLGMWGDRQSLITFLKWNVQPGIAKTVQDLYSASTNTPIGGRAPKQMGDVLLGFAGMQVERVNMEKALASIIYQKSKNKADDRAVFTQKKTDLKNDPEKLRALYELASVQYNETLRETGLAVDAAIGLGMSPATVQRLLKGATQSFSESERAAIVRKQKIMPKFKGYVAPK